MKKLLLFILLISLNFKAIAQLEIIDKTFDNTGNCLLSYKVKGTIPNYDANEKYYIYLTDPTKSKQIDITNISSTGNFISDKVNMNKTTNVTLFHLSNKTINIGLFPIIIPYPIAISSPLKLIHCQDDVDSDGVLNIDDKCVNEYGTYSNQGCPGNPDLTFDTTFSRQTSDCSSCNGTITHVNNNNIIPSIYRFGGNITINPLVVKNIGDGSSLKSVKIRFFFSKDNKLSSDDVGIGARTLNLQPLKAGETTFNDQPSTPYNQILKVSIDGNDIKDKLNYGIYYLIIIIDQDNTLGSESDRSNNIISLRVRYTGTLTKIGDDKIKVKVFDSNQIEVLDYETLDESNIRKELNNTNIKSGLYFINHSNGKYNKRTKIYKQ